MSGSQEHDPLVFKAVEDLRLIGKQWRNSKDVNTSLKTMVKYQFCSFIFVNTYKL